MKTNLHHITRIMIITAVFTLSACTVDTQDLSEQVYMVEATSSSTPATSSAAPSTSERGRHDNASWSGFAQLWSETEDPAKASTSSQVIANSTAAKAVVEQEALIVEQATAQADQETGTVKEK